MTRTLAGLTATMVAALALPTLGVRPGDDVGYVADRRPHRRRLPGYDRRRGQRREVAELSVQGRRSYCAEVGAHISGAQDPDENYDPSVTVYLANGTTVLTSNANTGQEPDSNLGSRACFIATIDGNHFVRVTDVGTGIHTFNVRVVETTLWASWFFIGGDYSAFTLLRNTTTENVSYTMRWRNTAGTMVGTTSGSVGNNAAIGINAKSFVVNQSLNFNGTVEIAHTGSPDALVGQVTSLSAVTGLGFDSMLFQRKVW